MKVAIIGGAGKMGQWFAAHLLQEGAQVVITGRNQAKLKSAGKKLGVTVADECGRGQTGRRCHHLRAAGNFRTVVKEIGPYARDGQMFFDVTSLKTQPVEIMHRYIHKGTILGTHPVFGPGAKSAANQNFVLTPTNEAEAVLAAKTRRYLEERGANVSIMTPANTTG